MTGRRNDRHFRVIVTEHTAGPKSGKYVEKLGFINPRTGEKKIDTERAKYWLSVGAKPSGRVHNMLVDEKVIEGPKINVLPKKTPIVNETEESQNETEASSEASEAQGAEAATPDTGAQAEDTNASDNAEEDAGQSDSDNKEETTQETPTEESSDNNEQSEGENTSDDQESEKEKEGE